MRPVTMTFALALAAVFGLVPMSGSAQIPPESSERWLEQGWSAAQRQTWYEASQGSRLIPLTWFRALERPNGDGMFLDDAYIASFRYLPRQGALPVGFAIDRQPDGNFSASRLRWRSGQQANEEWVGFNCAACHTAEITYQGTTLRVEGGPTMADFQGFFEAFNSALARTRDDEARFGRFAARVFGTVDNAGNRARLRRALSQLTDYQLRLAALNHTDLRYGYGRVDAIGNIFNKVAYIARPQAPTRNEPDAPVSYPFLWNVPQHAQVQWNGIAHNIPIERNGEIIDVGALGRNAGEAIGVFSDVQPRQGFQIGARSSVEARTLVRFEQDLMQLRPPRWPSEVFGAPNRTLAREGRDLYERLGCQTCHTPLQRTDLTTRSFDRMTLLTAANFDQSTDVWMACNTMTNEAYTGRLQGERPLLAFGRPLGRVEPVSEMLSVLVIQTISARAPELLNSGVGNFQGTEQRSVIAGDERSIVVTGGLIGGAQESAESASHEPLRRPGAYSRAERRDRCRAALADPRIARNLGYKARPLNGVWATAPYLHNGSVASLYELLLPPGQRRTTFETGSHEFDPRLVGFAPDPTLEHPFLFATTSAAGPVEGNSNGGHDYGVGSLTHDQRMAIVEYLKVIGEEF